jgi:pimeloyl-ACP methyl ester carboxylesterase
MDRNVSYDPERMALVGQSNGGLGAFHVARVRPDWFTTMVVMPGGYGGRGELDMLEGMPVLLAVGEQDAGWVQLTHNTRDLLRLAGAEPTVSIVPGAGHVFPYDPEKLFDWIQASFLE